MKKFFKALALVLALTLVIGSIPVSAATATIGIKKNRKSWVVFLGGAQGKKADGTQAGRKRTYKISKLVDGFDAETMDIKLSSDNKEIVTTSNKKDKVYGKKMGAATVTIYVYDIESEKLIGTTSILIKVKKNASEVNYYVADGDGNLVDTSKKLGVNIPYTVVLTRMVDGEKTDTDYRRLTCEDASVTIEADPAYKAHTKYTVTFTKSGEFTLVGGAYQSKAYDANIVEKEIKLTAGYDAVAVAQSGLASADVTFETDVVGLTADAFKAYYLIGETKIYPSAAQKVTCKDNVATVEFLSDFIQGYEYFVEYDGELVGSFKAAVVTADSVVAIEIPTQVFDAGAADCKLQYKLLNENGIDIKSLLGSTLQGQLQFEIVNGDIDTYITSGYDPVIYIGTADKSYVVKCTYTWFNANGDQKSVEGQGNVASVKPEPWKLGTVTGIVTAPSAGDYIGADGKIDGNVKAINWTMDNATSGAVLQIAVPYTKGNNTVIEGFNKIVDGPSYYTSYDAKSADETIVMLATEVPNGQKWALTANKPGSTTIIIYGVESNGNKTVIGAVPVEVKAKREAKTFTVTPSKNTLNTGYDSDTIEFTVVLKDQYDEEMKEVDYTVTNANKNDGTAGPVFARGTVLKQTGDGKFVLKGSDVTNVEESKTGVLNLKFTCGNLSQTIYVNCGNESVAATQVLKLSQTTLDTAIKYDTEKSSISISLEGRTKSGLTTDGAYISFTEEAPKSDKAGSGSSVGVSYVYTISKDGKVLKASDLGINFSGNSVTAVVPQGASGSAVKLAKGTYTVTAYKVENNGTNVIVSIVGQGQQTFTVEDKQIMPTVTKKDNAEKLGVIDDATVASAFDVKFNGSSDNITTKFNYTVDGDSSTAYVASVDVTIANKNGLGSFTINVSIDTLVKTGN